MSRRATSAHLDVLVPRLLVGLTAASITAIQFGVMGSMWCMVLGAAGSLVGALGMRQLTLGQLRLQVALLLGFSATWLSMWATTRHYADLDPVRDRDAVIQWLTLAGGLVLVLVPDRWLGHAHAGCVALHIVGLGAFATWFGDHCLP